MAFTVEDFHDLIELLAQHPEWRAELRRHVLSDDLLELPTLVRQLVEAQTRAEARLEGIESRLVGIDSGLFDVRIDVDRMDDRLGHVEGDLLELQYARRSPGYLGSIARRLRVIEPGPLSELLDDAVDEGRLTQDEREAVMLADIVLSGRRRDGQDVYLVVEVSAGIGVHDVDRAVERAAFLEKLGRPTLPVVAGRRINDQVAGLAAEKGVWYALGGRVVAPPGA